MRIVVPMATPSPNELRRKYRHYHAYKRLRQAWEQSLTYAVPSSSDHKVLLEWGRGKVRLRIMVYHSRLYDQDNLTGSIKPVLDALKNIGFIKDDSAEWVELAPVEQSHSTRAQARTVIDLEAV